LLEFLYSSCTCSCCQGPSIAELHSLIHGHSRRHQYLLGQGYLSVCYQSVLVYPQCCLELALGKTKQELFEKAKEGFKECYYYHGEDCKVERHLHFHHKKVLSLEGNGIKIEELRQRRSFFLQLGHALLLGHFYRYSPHSLCSSLLVVKLFNLSLLERRVKVLVIIEILQSL